MSDVVPYCKKTMFVLPFMSVYKEYKGIHLAMMRQESVKPTIRKTLPENRTGRKGKTSSAVDSAQEAVKLNRSHGVYADRHAKFSQMRCQIVVTGANQREQGNSSSGEPRNVRRKVSQECGAAVAARAVSNPERSLEKVPDLWLFVENGSLAP